MSSMRMTLIWCLCSFKEKGLSIDVHMSSIRKGYCNVFLEECLMCFKMCGDGKKYIYIYIYILWDMVFVICIGIICSYFVGHGSCICILCETWSLKIYEKCVCVFCEECVCKTYGSVR